MSKYRDIFSNHHNPEICRNVIQQQYSSQEVITSILIYIFALLPLVKYYQLPVTYDNRIIISGGATLKIINLNHKVSR